MSGSLKVFISVGTPGNKEQLEFRDAVIQSIRSAGLIPKRMTDLDWDVDRPIRGMQRFMADCSGAIIIAYTRYYFPKGKELRNENSSPMTEVNFPTAWNQIEAAMAFEKRLPLLVIAQAGLRLDAILKKTKDIDPIMTNLNTSFCSSLEFNKKLRSWKTDVEEVASRTISDTTNSNRDISVRQLFASLPWYEGLAVISTVVGLLLAALTIGYRLGSGEWPLG